MKKKLPIEAHIELGRKIKTIKDDIRSVADTIITSYGKTSRAGKQAMRSVSGMNVLEKICYEMDTIVCIETDRDEWQYNGYGFIYLGNKENFLYCSQCGKRVLQEREYRTQDGDALCHACNKK